MLLVSVITLLVIAALCASALVALRWATRDGQFNQLQAGANSIFDDEEPVGRVTDAFPPPRAKKLKIVPKETHS